MSQFPEMESALPRQAPQHDGSVDDVRPLAAALACAITVESKDEADCLAKNGPESLFAVIRTASHTTARGKSGIPPRCKLTY